MKSQKTGLSRIVDATRYSKQGLLSAWRNEAAFRQEILLLFILLPILFWLDVSRTEKLLLIITLLIVLVVELLNSAIENVVDLVSPDYHELAGRAKDIGSAAVFISILLAAITWGFILFTE